MMYLGNLGPSKMHLSLRSIFITRYFNDQLTIHYDIMIPLRLPLLG
jgi:hypothetical protein